MNVKKHIPNFLTCCNLLCGCLGIIKCFEFSFAGCFGGSTTPWLEEAGYLIFLACIFDFLDGFAARILKVSSPIGKELDSLADCVTFGVLPGLILFHLIKSDIDNLRNSFLPDFIYNLPYIALIIPIFSALRLAKFNVDTRQSESFIGVPTPANAILIASFPFIISQAKWDIMTSILTNAYWLLSITLVMSFLLIAELPLFALKFKSFKWNENRIRYSFLISSLILFIFLAWTAIPLTIFLYIGLSLFENKLNKTKSFQP
jgi:CDP-diacylglycerol--serine O-phosphatidyltransferase